MAYPFKLHRRRETVTVDEVVAALRANVAVPEAKEFVIAIIERTRDFIINGDEAAAALKAEYGYVSDHPADKWTIYQNRLLIVANPERRLRCYPAGCCGAYYEIEPEAYL